MEKTLIALTLVSSLGLGGCYSSVTGARALDQEEQGAAALSKSTWHEELPPIGEDCEEAFHRMKIVSYPTKEETARACGIPQSWQDLGTFAAGCYFHHGEGFVFDTTLVPTIVYFADQPLFPIIFHEFSHFGSACAFGNVDHFHSRKQVWDYVNKVNKQWMEENRPANEELSFHNVTGRTVLILRD